MYSHELNDLYETRQKIQTILLGRPQLPHVSNLYCDNQKLIFSTDKYRRSDNWNIIKKSRLIESFIINIPVAPLIPIETEKYGASEVVDGEQRIKAIVDFFGNGFKLKGMQAWTELNGKSYQDLPIAIKNALDKRGLETQTILISADSTLDRAAMKQTTYQRLNYWRLNEKQIK